MPELTPADKLTLDQRLAAMEATIQSNATMQRVSLLLSVAVFGFAVYAYVSRPAPPDHLLILE